MGNAATEWVSWAATPPRCSGEYLWHHREYEPGYCLAYYSADFAPQHSWVSDGFVLPEPEFWAAVLPKPVMET